MPDKTYENYKRRGMCGVNVTIHIDILSLIPL